MSFLIHRAGRSLLWMLVLSGIVAASAAAQIPRTAPALQLAGFENNAGIFHYRYRLAGFTSDGEVLSDVYLDVTMPRGSSRPSAATPIAGQLLFDAIHEQAETLPYSHPELRIGTPPKWSAAIYLQGVLSWGATRYSGGDINYGIRRGATLTGFELRSKAVPALRRFRVEPYRPVGSVDSDPTAVDSTLVVLDGWVVAPGWDRDVVTGDFLHLQVKNACEAVLLSNCGRYLRYTDDVRDAEARRNDRSYRLSLESMRRYLASDTVSHQNARFVLTHAIQALQQRPPSRRSGR